MSYTSIALVRENYKKFVNTTLFTDAQITYTIARVDGLINGILYKLYAIPLYSTQNATPYTPEIIVTIATDMVTAKLLKYYYNSNQSEENPIAKNMWKENIELLKSMVASKPELLLPCDFRTGVSLNEKGQIEFGSATTASSGIWSTSMNEVNAPYNSIFNLDDWTDSKVCENQEYDIQYDRDNK